MSLPIIGALLALISAVLYGTGDFSGGVAARRIHSYAVLLLSALASIVLACILLLIRPESTLSGRDLFFAAVAGLIGAVGLTFLYSGLSTGSAAVVAPTSGVVSAVFPAVVGILIDSLPKITTLIGFVTAFLGIWLVTRSQDSGNHDPKRGLLLGILAGIGFGGYFVLIAQVSKDNLILPLLVVKIAALLVALVLMWIYRISMPSIKSNSIALLSGTFDFTANGFYLVATQLTRMDVAAVLSSLFPAATVFLSVIFFREKINPGQWVGVVFCVAAIALIVL